MTTKLKTIAEIVQEIESGAAIIQFNRVARKGTLIRFNEGLFPGLHPDDSRPTLVFHDEADYERFMADPSKWV